MLRKKLFGNPFADIALKENTRTEEDQSNLLDLSLENCCPSDVSKYFPNIIQTVPSFGIADHIIQLQQQLNNNLRTLEFRTPPIQYVYNPLEYASDPNERFTRKYCTTRKKLLFVGMNPGPFGMCQTGVPFGDPKWVIEWLKINGFVFKPEMECPERRIQGFSSNRKEQSGDKFWGFFAALCKVPEIFFKHSFVCNFCPLAFMDDKGRNVTPVEIKDIQLRKILERVCDDWYLKLINILQPECIIAIGRYIEKRTKDLFKSHKIQNIKVVYMPHPSPRVRTTENQDWSDKAQACLMDNNLSQFFVY
ncbi:unnamed protein product [Phaedon cochleariae]|uniref:Uracil-DNA glycosylase-like domain-containing protein n=1 Tax=Phaedon cochleariae TaxID=80249 RepID=A0A9P0DX18_PHACE|nr:unnamed protein product [Phaedon cochleariae]